MSEIIFTTVACTIIASIIVDLISVLEESWKRRTSRTK